MLARVQSNGNIHASAGRKAKGTPATENSLEVSYQIKHAWHSIQQTHPTDLSKWTENLGSHRNLHAHF